MNYGDYVKNVAKRANLSQAETKRVMSLCFEVLVDALDAGEEFTLPDLGTFGTKVRKKYTAYNTANEKVMQHPRQRVVTYVPSSSITNEMNKAGKSYE